MFKYTTSFWRIVKSIEIFPACHDTHVLLYISTLLQKYFFSINFLRNKKRLPILNIATKTWPLDNHHSIRIFCLLICSTMKHRVAIFWKQLILWLLYKLKFVETRLLIVWSFTITSCYVLLLMSVKISPAKWSIALLKDNTI